MALSKQSIRKHAGMFTPREVHVPAWADESGDDVVLVRGMTIAEYELSVANDSEGESTASVIAKCVLAPDGTRLFDDADVQWISQLPLAQIRLLDKAIIEESGLSDGDPAKAVDRAVADAEGNSGTTGSSASSTDSPSD